MKGQRRYIAVVRDEGGGGARHLRMVAQRMGFVVEWLRMVFQDGINVLHN